MTEIMMTATSKFLDEAEFDTTMKRVFTNKLTAKIETMKEDVIAFLQSNMEASTSNATTQMIANLLDLMAFSIMMTSEIDRKLTLQKDPKATTINAYDILERAMREYLPGIRVLSHTLQQSINPTETEEEDE